MNLRIGRISRVFNPNLGDCLRCHTTWRFVHSHDTSYTSSRGMFPLCEKCWSDLTPEERLPFYRELVDRWTDRTTDSDDWPAIQAAVLRGK